MNDEARARWDRLQTLYLDALDREPDEQKSFLREACGTDDKLYLDVCSLLDAKVPTMLEGHALDQTMAGLALGAISKDRELPGKSDPPTTSMDGQLVGPYRVVRTIGSGGMGSVYLAERVDGQFEQTVALKLVKRGMDTDAVVARFQAERQILARLVHPNIGRLLDGGVHIDGRPYFALEFVAGETITEYCDARSLPILKRLRLFEDVCRAVAYAHRNLVVHRDLKPSNILVTEDRSDSQSGEAKPIVKLLDFGIAKLLADDAGDLLTRTGERVLTPAYAAPEQIRGEAITTATDVYGLGVVLYELLAGVRPFDPEQRLGNERVSRTTRSLTSDPQRPSAALSRVSKEHSSGPTTVSAEDVAKLRSTTPDRLAKSLKGDLDTIVLTALRDEPDRRYASAQDLLADLRAYRDNRPVSARPESPGYRFRKYVDRHRLGFVTTVAAMLIASLLITFYTLQLKVERDRAQLEAEKSEQIASFLKGLFENADPFESGGEDITARDLLDRGAERIDSDLSGQGEIRSEMMNLIGEVYSNLGSHEEAETMFNETLRLRRTEGNAANIAKTLIAFGFLNERQGRYGDAIEKHEEAIAIIRDTPTADKLILAEALHALSFLRLRMGRYDQAETLIREALEIKYAEIGDDDPSIAYSLNILADLLTFKKQFDQAEATHLRALDIRRRHLGDAHLDVAYTLHNLGATMRDQDRNAEAEAYYREALAVWRRHYGYDHRETSNTLSQLALVIGLQGRFDESDSLQNVAMEMTLGSVGPDHPQVASIKIRAGDVALKAGRLEKAEQLYRSGIELMRRAVGEKHPAPTRWQIRLGTIIVQQGRREDGLDLIRESESRCDDLDRGGYPECAEQVRTALSGIGIN